jgi:signal transduction histidine kinase
MPLTLGTTDRGHIRVGLWPSAVKVSASTVRDEPSLRDAQHMRSRPAPVALRTAVAFVGLTATAASASVAIAAQGQGFTFATPDAGGRVALLGPVALCLTAAVVQLTRHRDRSRVAVLVTAAALAWSVAEWDNPEATSALLFSLGLAGFAAAPAVVFHLALTDARGRLPGQAAAALVGAGYVVTLGVQGVLSAVGFDPAAGGCVSCPANLWHAGTIAGWVDTLGVRTGLAWSVAAVLALVLLVLRASRARRRTMGPRWTAAALFLVATVVSYARSNDPGFLGTEGVDRRLWLVQAAALAAVAVSVLGEMVRERRTERALTGLVVDLSGPSSPTGSLRDALATRLGDPSLVLAFPVDGGQLVDQWAQPVELPSPSARAVTRLDYAGDTLAILVHRTDLLGSRDAVDDLVGAIHLGLEHERLQAEALVQVDELRASGIRLVAAGDDERRRLERDLHDGAQQRLVGLALGLRLLAARSGESAALKEATRELQAAIDDLRALARGLAPLVLAEAGLATAVRALGESRDVQLTEAPDGRFPAVIESTAYLAVDRATEASPAVVAIRSESGRLTTTVRVEGPDVDLGDLTARTTTLGGELSVRPSTAGWELALSLPLSSGRAE